MFADANAKLRAAEAERDAFKQQLDQFGPAKVEELTKREATVRSERDLRIALTRAGVHRDEYLDYLSNRFAAFEAGKAPKLDEWIGTLKQQESAFFGTPAATAPPVAQPSTATPPAPAAPPTPPRSSPDATAPAPSSSQQDPPLSDALIKGMDPPTFRRRWAEIDAFMRARRG